MKNTQGIESLIDALAERSVRLWVEDGQLRFAAPKGVVTGELRDAIVARKAELVTHLANSGAPLRRARAAPVQEMLWSMCQQSSDTPSLYIEARAATLTGEIRPDALQHAFDALVARHDSLRTSFEATADGVWLRIARHLTVPIEQSDLVGAGTGEVDASIRETAWRPFDLEAGPLVRMGLFRIAADEWILVLSQHHLVTDRWSAGLLVHELSALYDAVLEGRSAHLPALPTSYEAYASRQQTALTSDRHAGLVRHWQDCLAGIPQRLELPLDRPDPPHPDYNGARVMRRLDRQLSRRLDDYCRSRGRTPFMVLSAAYAALLHRLSGQQTIVLGTPVANRSSAELETVAGYFVNTLPLRTDPEPGMNFDDLSRQLCDRALDAFEHQDIPFGHLAAALPVERGNLFPPIFQTMIVVQNVEAGALSLGPAVLESLPLDPGTAKYPLMVTFLPHGDGTMSVQWDYQTALFDAFTIESIAEGLLVLIDDALARPEVPLGALSVMADETAEQLLAIATGSTVPYPREDSLPVLFARQVARTPERIALAFGEDHLTYAELATRVDTMACRLLTTHDGEPAGARVGVFLPRGPDMIIAQLAILRIGATFVPLDPGYPDDRLAFMAHDAGLSVLVAGQPVSWCAAPVVVPDTGEGISGVSLPALPDDAQAIAYVMYTSGSTGRPKGVEVRHRGGVRLVMGSDYLPFGPDRVFLQFSSPSFDASTLEIWGALLHGAKLVLPSPGPDALDELAELVARHGVDVLWLTSGLFSTLVESGIACLSGVRHLLVGGDALSPHHVARAQAALPQTRLINGYGPTENTTFTCCHELGFLASRRIVIGRPIANTTVHVLDSAGRPVPPGVPGTLWTGGDGLAAGYLDRPDQTAERFVAMRLCYGHNELHERLYDTGDRARWCLDPDGSGLAVEILGRNDDQVKIRGFRVELGEIESQLNALSGVAVAAVAVQGAEVGNKRLIAFYVPARDGRKTTPAGIAEHLAATLPSYMVPDKLVPIEALPITTQGKVDRKALAGMPLDGSPMSTPAGPVPEGERELAAIWQQLFDVPSVNRTDDFFDLGGHSLLAVRLIAAVRERWKSRGRTASITVRAVFDHPRLCDLAATLESGAPDDADAGPLVPGDGSSDLAVKEGPLSFAQERLWTLEKMVPLGAAYVVPGAFRLRGDLDVARLESALGLVLSRHCGLSAVFEDNEGTAVQRFGAPLRPCLVPKPVDASDLAAVVAGFAQEPFDLEAGPLTRAALFVCGPDDHVLGLSMHHLVCDGWSIGVLLDELSRAYAGEPLPPVLLQYPAFATWQRQYLNGFRLAELETYWKQKLADLPTLDLITDFTRPALSTSRGGHVPFRLAATGLDALCRSRGVTRFMVCLAAFSCLLNRHSQQDDFAVGTPVSGRHHRDVETLVGFLADNLVLRTPIETGETFSDYLARTRETVLEAFAHQDLPFTLLLEAVQPARRLDMPPLFQVMLSLDDGMDLDLELEGVRAEPLAIELPWSKYDLGVTLRSDGDGLVGDLEYNADIFSPASAERLARHFERLVDVVLRAPDTPIGRIDLRSDEERARPPGLAGPRVKHPFEGGLHRLVSAQASRTPDAVAVIASDTGETMDFATLERQAGAIAEQLRAGGVRPGGRIGIHAYRGMLLPAAVLGILKSGCAFVPLNPDHPPERLAAMSTLAELAGVLHEGVLPASLAQGCVLDLTGIKPHAEVGKGGDHVVDPETPAYVMFTSGSTGVPKGVVVPHRAICNYVGWLCRRFDVGPDDAIAMTSSFDFDASLMELFAPLVSGGRLVVPTGVDSELLSVSRLIEQYALTILVTVPSLYRVLLSDGMLESCRGLRLVVSGGEPMPRDLLRDLMAAFPHARVTNHYGPTEACIDTLCLDCHDGIISPVVPLGHPVDNADVMIADEDGRPVADGLPGELTIAGDGVFLGYLGVPELTAKAFLSPLTLADEGKENPSPASRRYRTGDRARIGPWGVEYLGRMDNQIKIHGVRMEAGEIEGILAAHSGVRDVAVVAVKGNGVAVMSRKDAAIPVPDESEIRASLAARLPRTVTLTHILWLEKVPRLASGKPDRQTIADLVAQLEENGGRGDGSRASTPRTPSELLVLEVWREVLGHDDFDIDDNFFGCGGQSLRAIQVAARLRSRAGVEVSVRDVFEHATISALAVHLDGMAARQGAPEWPPALLPRRHEAAEGGAITVPLSHGQRSLWFLDRLEGGSAAYTTVSAFVLDGEVDTGAIRYALDGILARHEALRSRFVLEDASDEPVQIVDPPIPFPVIVHDEVVPDDSESLHHRALAAASNLFDLSRDLPIRFELFPISSGRFLGVLSWHHIATDGWSLGIFVRELVALYRAHRGRTAPALAELPVQYGDYAAWQRELLAAPDFAARLAFWRLALADAPTSLTLFTDRPRPARQTFRGRTHRFRIPAEDTARANDLARQTGSSLYMVGLAVFFVLLRRWSRQEDILVGTPVANRPTAETERLVGFFANTLVLRGRPRPSVSFRSFLDEVRENVLNAFAHQDVPFERLVEELNPDRHLDHAPVFQAMFNLQNTQVEPMDLPGLSIEPLEIDTGTAKFDLNLTLIESSTGGLEGYWEYSTDLFGADTAERMAQQYVASFETATQMPQAGLDDIPMLSRAARQELLAAGQGPSLALARDQLLHHLVEEQAEKTPDDCAVVFGEDRLSYREFERLADRLAERLVASGVMPGTPVGIRVARLLDLPVAMFGILKAGGFYVPLDGTLPPARLDYIVADAGLHFIVTDMPVDRDPSAVPASREVPVVDADEKAGPGNTPRRDPGKQDAESPVYQLYTSGSTGSPKGVRMPHRALVNLVRWQIAQPGFAPGRRVLQFTTPGFDVASQEIFTTLASGGTLVMMPEALRRDMPAMLAYIADHQVERLFLPFTALRSLAEAWPLAPRQPGNLREIITAGERLRITGPLRALFQVLRECRLTNQYGPTETHVVCAHTLPAAPDSWPEFPAIGTPVANCALYVLDDGGKLLPPGVPGQLWVGGTPVGNGYPSLPELTAGAFRPDPFGAGERMYATGDLASLQLDPDGGARFVFLGRTDQQVKIRGYRVEPEEVEHALLALDGIAAAAVVPRQDANGEYRLVAYYVASGGPALEMQGPALRPGLAAVLPDHMLPTRWILLDSLPLTTSGKLDRRALPEPEDAELETEVSLAPPRSSTERKLAAIWARVLERSDIGLHDNFFDLGGYSFVLLRVLKEIQASFPGSQNLAMVDLFERPTIASLAPLLSGTQEEEAPVRHRGDERHGRAAQRARRRDSRRAGDGPVPDASGED